MGCKAIGDLRAYLDGELAVEDRVQVEEHVASCAACRREVETLRANASLAAKAIDLLAPSVAPGVAWSRVRERAEGRVGSPVTLGWRMSNMFGDLWRFAGGSRLRIAASTLVLLAVLGTASTLSPVQTMASSFLSIFRVNKFVAVTIDPSSLPNLAAPSDLGSFTITGDSKPKQVPLAEASKAAGFQVLTPSSLPSGLEATPKSTTVTGASKVTYVPDMKKVRAYLSSIGASNVSLPDNLDGAPITLQMQPTVSVLYAEAGGANRESDGTIRPRVGQRYLYVGETTSPTMNVPEGIDVEKIRTEMLKVPGLPPDLVNQIKAVEDWRNTVVVPVVKGTSREVTVQGEKGLLITDASGHGTTLLWLKGGVVYTLTGNLSDSEILATANSMR